MKKLSIIIIASLSIFYIGCKKTHCPAFPADLNYFPYYKGQELKFTNSQNDIRCFTVANKEKSKSEDFAWNCKCYCNVYTMFRTNLNQDSLGLEYTIRVGGLTYARDIDLECRFQKKDSNDYYSEYLFKNIIFGEKFPYEEISNYLDNTITLEKEDNTIVKKIVIIKGKGLVSYVTADGEEWKLVE